ncbi:anaerobic ribonucleoside-triphosphate reductase activating protein [Labilibaculum filiforme]|uniref:Anaerobic ribonucleoside-triphosphate reductase activating protein n=1 Tax=Labilibaculum filiforme TaxID=1940526 RepID=A0A2N3I1I7_9BACT|nr:anaerobic ribonucleoside-triphosphate reductase activating protein [Labilibaculum filiforme]PKQ64185.1 anaerobic ribonucleoside-triphosphate reductase activating protein [Labilibaculum filiforme]
MKISGFIKNSLIDCPGKIASVIFTQGCNMACKFCHNWELIPNCHPMGDTVDEQTVFHYLKKSIGFVDALVITGGEPTVQVDLIPFIRKVKDLGLYVKLDTNGTNPKLLRLLLQQKLIDYVAMDLKTIPELPAYQKLVGNQFTENQLLNVKKTIEILKDASLQVEFRTTLIRECHSSLDVRKMCELLEGDCKYNLQAFSPHKVLDADFETYSSYSPLEIEEMIGYNKDVNSNVTGNI